MQKRNTYQKRIILETVNNSMKHPTADEIYETVILSNPCISKATVYRNLKVMSEEGLIKKLEISNSKDRYDNNIKHYHAKCIACNHIYDIDIPYNIELDVQDESLGILGHDIIFKVVCKTCQKKERE